VHTLDSNGLGSLGATPNKTGTSTIGGKDPIADYGKKAASLIMEEFQALPASQREGGIRKLLDQVDPKLYASYKAETAKRKMRSLLEVIEENKKNILGEFPPQRFKYDPQTGGMVRQ